MVSVTFHGLCGIGRINGVYQASMPTVMGHRAVLMIPVKQFDITRTTEPEFIFHDTTNEQIAGWNLGARTLKFDGATREPMWSSKADLIDLSDLNVGKRLKASDSAAVLQLPEGDLKPGTDKEVYDVFQGGKIKEPKKKAVISIVWSGEFDTLRANDGSLNIFLIPRVPPGGFTITNVAPITNGSGATHFEHYYSELFDQNPPPDPSEIVTIVNKNVEVYDCVPSVPLP